MWGFLCRHIKAIEQYFHVVLFIMLYKVVLTFKSVDETLVCDHSNESYWAVLSRGTVYYAVRDVRNGALVVGWSFQWHLLHVNSGSLSMNFTSKKNSVRKRPLQLDMIWVTKETCSKQDSLFRSRYRFSVVS